MNRKLLGSIIAAFVIFGATVGSSAQPASAVGTSTMFTAAGAGVFPAGANFQGVQLAGGTFAVGVSSDGVSSANGDLEVQLNGNSLIGLTQWITVTGWITSATSNPDGSVTLNGTGSLDMGDGTAPVGGLPLVATLSSTGITVTIGGNGIPTLPKSDGWFFSE